MKTETTKVDDSMFGGNASAEGGDEGGAEDASQSGIDVVLAHRQVVTSVQNHAIKKTLPSNSYCGAPFRLYFWGFFFPRITRTSCAA